MCTPGWLRVKSGVTASFFSGTNREADWTAKRLQLMQLLNFKWNVQNIIIFSAKIRKSYPLIISIMLFLNVISRYPRIHIYRRNKKVVENLTYIFTTVQYFYCAKFDLTLTPKWFVVRTSYHFKAYECKSASIRFLQLLNKVYV